MGDEHILKVGLGGIGIVANQNDYHHAKNIGQVRRDEAETQ